MIWAVVAVVALETYAAFRVYWIERHNALIRSFRNEATDALPIPAPAPELDRDCIADHLVPVPWSHGYQASEVMEGHNGGDAESNPAAPSWYFASRQEDRSARAARRAVFPALSEEDRQLFAIIHNEAIVAVGQDGAFKHVYGNTTFPRAIQFFSSDVRGRIFRWLALRRLWNQFCEDIRHGAQNPEAGYKTVRFFMGDIIEPVDAYFLPAAASAADEGTVFAFLETDQALLKFGRASLPPDSPWAAPFFEYRKNLRGSYSGLGIALETNSFGFRDNEITVPKPEGVFRIACIGASTTEEGETLESSYPNRLERMLDAYFPNKKIEVVNCGISGLSAMKHMGRLPDYLALEPDLIVVYMGINDVCHHCLGMARMDYPLWKHVLRNSRFVRRHWNSILHPSAALMRRELALLPLADLRAMHRVTASRGIPMAICSFAYPDPDCLERAEVDFLDYYARTRCHDICLSFATYCRMMQLYNEEVRALCKSENILYVPVAECLRAGLSFFSDMCHMHEEGIERKAEIIFEALKDYIRPAVT